MNISMAAGIELAAEQINLAMLKQSKTGIHLLKCASVPMPEGALAGGIVKNPVAIAKAVKELCSKNKVSVKNLVISLVAKPVITRIMDLPKDISSTPGQFVRDELKHCAALAGKNIAQDFCSISTNKKLGIGRVLAVAADEDKVSGMVNAFNRFGMAIKAIEPNVIAAARALHAKNIKKFGTNVVFIFNQDAVTTLCVFRDGHFDFIRSTNLSDKDLESQEGIATLLEEVSSIRQFYDLEVEDAAKKWEMLIAVESRNQEPLRAAITEVCAGMTATYCDPTTAESVLPLADCAGKTVSIAAAGLAMRLLNTPSELKLNLVPPRTDEIHNMKKYGLLCANAAAAVFLLVLLSVPLLKSKITEAHKLVAQKKAVCNCNLDAMSKKQALLNEQSKTLADELAQVSQLGKIQNNRDWSGLLIEVARRTPQQLRILNLSAKDERTVILTGQALSNDDVHLFVKMLTKSAMIETASLVKTEEDGTSSKLIMYTISCTLPNLKGLHANAN